MSTLGGFFKRVVSTLLLPLAPSPPPSFTTTFERDYGPNHPPFLDSPSLPHALASARASCRLLIVYLPSSSPRDDKRHKAFCRTLTDPDLIRFLHPSFVLWSPPPSSTAYKLAVKELSARRLPYLGVVHGGREGGRKGGKVSVKSLHHFKPPPAPEQAVVWLNRTLEVREGGREGGREGRGGREGCVGVCLSSPRLMGRREGGRGRRKWRNGGIEKEHLLSRTQST